MAAIGGVSPWRAFALGAASFATMPVAIAATRFSGSYDLLHAGFAIPLALGLGWAAVRQARRARARVDVALGGSGRSRPASLGRAFGIAGICVASSCLIALGVYGALTYLAA